MADIGSVLITNALNSVYGINRTTGGLTTIRKGNTHLLKTIMTQKGDINIYGKLNHPLPLELTMKGLQAMWNEFDGATYLYGIEDNILIRLKGRKAELVGQPPYNLSKWEDMEEYLINLSLS